MALIHVPCCWRFASALAGNPLAVHAGPDRLAGPTEMKAMAEIDQPCSRDAVASTSSFPVNMKEIPFPEGLVWTPRASGGPPSLLDGHSTGRPRVGISMSRSGGEWCGRGQQLRVPIEIVRRWAGGGHSLAAHPESDYRPALWRTTMPGPSEPCRVRASASYTSGPGMPSTVPIR